MLLKRMFSLQRLILNVNSLFYIQILDKITLKIDTASDGTNQIFTQPIMSMYIFKYFYVNL
jgi:hypothetical protein